jgi:nicotinamidase-related amidase
MSQEWSMKPALLVIDVQKRYFKISPQTAQSLDEAVEYINAAIEIFREKDLPVVCIQHMDKEDKLMPGDEDFEIPDQLDILQADFHVHKTYGNSFNKTPLEGKLHESGVDTVIVTGFCAEYCVLSTARGAEDCDFNAIILRGALASTNPENIRFVESINEVISYGALKTVLAA